MNKSKTLLCITAILLAGCQATSNPPVNTSAATDARYMREFRLTSAPTGHTDFCLRHPGDCVTGGEVHSRVKMSREKMAELNSVNIAVNNAIQPSTDQQIFGRGEYWTYPSNYGDCEDYVLLKRKLLIQKGWSENNLLITVLRDEKNEGHAVLTVATDMGDLVLDNKNQIVKPWSDTPYTYYLRQSRSDTSKWVNLSASDLGTRPLVTTRVRAN